MNYIIWIIIGGVVILMAVIGYIAENKNKAKQKTKDDKKIPEVNLEKIEASEGAATWSKNAKPKDERHETEHKVPSVDDWSKIPETPDKKPTPKQETPKEEAPAMFDDIHNNESDIKEVSTQNAVPLPADNQPVAPTPMPAPPAAPAPAPVPNGGNKEVPSEAANVSNAVPQEQNSQTNPQTEAPKEQITEPASTENIWN